MMVEPSTLSPDLPSRPVALIADAHLGGPGGTGATLQEQLDALTPDTCGLALFMGDLFHVWVGDSRFETTTIRSFLPTLEALRRRGIPAVYIEGNRDFFLQHSPYVHLFDYVGLEYAFRLGTSRYLAIHGDGLNAKDRRYLFWRWLSKNRLSQTLCRMLPGSIGRRTVTWTESQLAKTNFEHKQRVPEHIIQAYGEGRLSRGHDVLLLGHFHVQRRMAVAGGEVRLLNAWYKSQQLEWLTP